MAPRIFEGRVMLPEEQEKIYEEIIQFERMEFVSPPMRELILDVWPELAHKLPPEDAAPPDERAWYWSFHDSVDRPSDVRANGHSPTLEAAKGRTCYMLAQMADVGGAE